MPIRNAELDDLDQIAAIEKAVFTTDRLSRRSLRAFITSDKASLLVATRRGKVLGYSLTGFRKGSQFARLYSLAVAPGVKGVGRKLLRASEKVARERACEALRLEVRADNQRAKKLYEKSGYVCFEEIEHYYEDGETALRMVKSLK
jgi:ribosomal protein S18 acetylase RimI-like enzyme